MLWSEGEHWGVHRSRAEVEGAEMVEVMGGGFALERHKKKYWDLQDRSAMMRV